MNVRPFLVFCAIIACTYTAGMVKLAATGETGGGSDCSCEALEARLADVEEAQAELAGLMPLVADLQNEVAGMRAEQDALQVRVGAMEGEELPARVAALEARLSVLWTAVEAMSSSSATP